MGQRDGAGLGIFCEIVRGTILARDGEAVFFGMEDFFLKLRNTRRSEILEMTR